MHENDISMYENGMHENDISMHENCIHENDISMYENECFATGVMFSPRKCPWVIGLYTISFMNFSLKIFCAKVSFSCMKFSSHDF